MRGGKTTSDNTSTGAVRTLARGLRILSRFSLDRPEWTLSELAKDTGIHVATTFRLVKTLEAEGYLTLQGDKGKYHLGPVATQLGYLVQSHGELARISRPYLEALAEETGETAELVIESDGTVFVIDEVLTRNHFKPTLPVGRTVEGFAKASGKLFLALRPVAVRAEMLRGPLPARTKFTITDPTEFEEELQLVASDNIAFDLEEDALGVCAVASAVRGQFGEVRGALQLVIPKERFSPSERASYVGTLREAVSALSARLAHAGQPAIG